jgi:hypothetical protein
MNITLIECEILQHTLTATLTKLSSFPLLFINAAACPHMISILNYGLPQKLLL